MNGEEKDTAITGVLKKEYTGKMYTFITDNGEITVTADHLLMVRDDKGNILELPAEIVAENIELYEIACE